jgi:general secretion pathway protein I
MVAEPVTKLAAGPRNRAAGFTLLEVLVAMAIFAVVAMALLNAGRDQIQTSARLEEKTFAHWVAMNRIAELQSGGQLPDSGRGVETVTMAGQSWRIVIQVEPTPAPNVKRMTVDVGHAPGNFGDDPPVITSLTAFAGVASHAQQSTTTP